MEDIKTQIIVDNSKFISYIYLDFDKEQLQSILNDLKKEHKKSRHICYAYSINVEGVEEKKYNDDGEPKGTAGLPILSIIEKSKYSDILIIVVRYFGGKKLGSSKLLRTYMKAALNSINELKERE